MNDQEMIWSDFFKRLNQERKIDEIQEEYKKLTSDQDRIIYTLKLMHEYNVIPKECGDKKDAKKSVSDREKGNQTFTVKKLNGYKCLTAFKLYTESIACAPYPSEELAIAFANRSAVLHKLKKYKECIADIDRALNLPYPEHMHLKIHIRKAECQAALNDSAVNKTIKEAEQCLEKLSFNDTVHAKFMERINSISNGTVQKQNRNKSTKESSKQLIVPVIESKNPEAPCASDALAIKYDNKYGRHVVATRDIDVGEILVVEKPFSSMLVRSALMTHCANCMEVSWCNIPCENCTYAMYCSDECKAAEFERCHDIECSAFPSLIKMDFSKLDLFSLRFAILALRETNSIQKLREEVKNVEACEDPREKGFSENGLFESHRYRSIYSLVGNTEKRTVRDLLRRSFDSCFILYFLATYSSMFGKPLEKDLLSLAENDDVTFIGGLIMRHQQIIPSNMHNFAEEFELGLLERGITALPFHSLINHSCNPNVTRHSRYTNMIVQSIQPIMKGCQVLDNYGPYYTLSPKAQRQRSLSSQYHFTCDCIACEQDWPVYYNIPSYQDLLLQPAVKYTINKTLQNFSRYLNLLSTGHAVKPEITKDLSRMIQGLYDALDYGSSPIPCREMCDLVESLKRALDIRGNTFEIPHSSFV